MLAGHLHVTGRRFSAATALIVVASYAACAPIPPRAVEGEATIAADQDGEQLFAYHGDVEPLEIGDQAPVFEFTDHEGTGRHLVQLRGSVVVVTFCQAQGESAIDTEILARMARLQRAFKAGLAAEVVLLTVIIDPRVDAATHLSALAERASSGPPQWIFALANARQTARLAAAFGVGIWRRPGGDVAHNFNTVLIGRNGEIVDQFPGIEAWTIGDVVAAASVAAER